MSAMVSGAQITHSFSRWIRGMWWETNISVSEELGIVTVPSCAELSKAEES